MSGLPTLKTSSQYNSQILGLLQQYAQKKQDPAGGTTVYVVPDNIFLQIEHGLFPNTGSSTDTSGEVPLDGLGGQYKGAQLQASSNYVAPGAPAVGAAASTAAQGIAGSIGSLLPSFITSLGFWKGLGLVIAGGLLLVFAALEFRKL